MQIIFDHTCITGLLVDVDPFLNGLYVEASYGYVQLLVPALSTAVADREKPGTGTRFLDMGKHVSIAPFTAEHARITAPWGAADWRILHPAALAIDLTARGENCVLLSLQPDLYEGTGVTPLNPNG